MTYSEKLKDRRWQKKRLELLEAAEWKCQNPVCPGKANSKKQLHIHHRFYTRNTMPWDYPDWAFAVLCSDCHEKEQERMEAAHIAMARNRWGADLLMVLAEFDDENRNRLAYEFWNLLSINVPRAEILIRFLSSMNGLLTEDDG